MLPATRRRIRQGLLALVKRRERLRLPAHYAAVLPDDVVAAWNRLAPFDQHHLIAVANELRRSGSPNTVVIAGVLHDIGKNGNGSAISRTVVVLLKRFAPSMAEKLRQSPNPVYGVKGVHVLLNHADAGARLLEQCGVRQEIVWLVRHHESTSTHPYLLALQAADNRH